MSEAGNLEERIRERAYALWEQDGRPDGRSDEYWEQARQEIETGEMTETEPSKSSTSSKSSTRAR